LTAVTAKADKDALDAIAPGDAAADVAETRPAAPGRPLPSWLQPVSPAWIWGGLVLAALGFGLIALAWGQSAGETQVYRQLPFLASAGLTGLGLIIVGVTLVNVSSRARDAIDRDRQLDELVEVMEELRVLIDSRKK